MGENRVRLSESQAEARSTEAFVALSLLTVTGTSLLTQRLGFSDSLGAFVAGVILAETNFRAQIEADLRCGNYALLYLRPTRRGGREAQPNSKAFSRQPRPFRGLLLGLFFVSTGSSIDLALIKQNWPTASAWHSQLQWMLLF